MFNNHENQFRKVNIYSHRQLSLIIKKNINLEYKKVQTINIRFQKSNLISRKEKKYRTI